MFKKQKFWNRNYTTTGLSIVTFSFNGYVSQLGLLHLQVKPDSQNCKKQIGKR